MGSPTNTFVAQGLAAFEAGRRARLGRLQEQQLEQDISLFPLQEDLFRAQLSAAQARPEELYARAQANLARAQERTARSQVLTIDPQDISDDDLIQFPAPIRALIAGAKRRGQPVDIPVSAIPSAIAGAGAIQRTGMNIESLSALRQSQAEATNALAELRKQVASVQDLRARAQLLNAEAAIRNSLANISRTIAALGGTETTTTEEIGPTGEIIRKQQKGFVSVPPLESLGGAEKPAPKAAPQLPPQARTDEAVNKVVAAALQELKNAPDAASRQQAIQRIITEIQSDTKFLTPDQKRRIIRDIITQRQSIGL